MFRVESKTWRASWNCLFAGLQVGISTWVLLFGAHELIRWFEKQHRRATVPWTTPSHDLDKYWTVPSWSLQPSESIDQGIIHFQALLGEHGRTNVRSHQSVSIDHACMFLVNNVVCVRRKTGNHSFAPSGLPVSIFPATSFNRFQDIYGG
jgi:hypothetical protein